ncbi:histidine phosphatase family protein, partial [Lactobacillus sp. XV13L]|nr:histidine phosphatase family protein [Lactobacillus sp. XV13L]
MMKLLVARHGETFLNKQRKFYGTLDAKLDKTGLQQAQILAKKVILRHPTILAQTNLQRTIDTLSPIRKMLPNLPVITIPDLMEKGFGDWEGLDADQIQQRYPLEWEKWLSDPLNYT